MKETSVLTKPIGSSNFENRKQFQHWLSLLIFINQKPENKEFLTQYFFNNFASHPEKFYAFLGYYKKHLSSVKNQEIKKKLASQYLEFLAPLCNRFNFFEENSKLNDLCFKISDPNKFEQLNILLLNYKKKAKNHIKNIIKNLDKLLQEKNYPHLIKGRYKSIYSIYKKMKKFPTIHVLELNDIFAFRIILLENSIEKCFEVLSLLHNTFQPLPDFFKDYITIPKINGYQSLHTGLSNVIPKLDIPIEVQIRTKEMNEFAENGLAAHWLYSQEKKSKLLNDKEKKLINYFSDIASGKKDKGIFCFSYKGDISKIENEYTALDFAYHIHSELGNKATAALVNGKKKPLWYKIKEGDNIKILKAETDQVKEKWLRYVTSKVASKKIIEYLKNHET